MTKTIWVIEDDVALRMILDDTLSDAGFTVLTFGNGQLAWQCLQDNAAELPEVIITDIRMPLMDGLTFGEKMREHYPDIPVIIMTAHADVQSAVDSYQAGAFDYLPKPFELDDLINLVQKAWQHSQHLAQQRQALHPSADTHTIKDTTSVFTTPDNAYQASVIGAQAATSATPATHPAGIIGQSATMQTVFRAIGRLADIPMTVLITGESGTGKELIAAALHEHSPRQSKPLIALNMAAIPHDLIEAELFGHEKGAFTGATVTRQGRFEQAHGGTLFLDEIGDMPLPTQTRLLRVLANGEFYRVGGQKPIKVDVRIIAATHQNLEDLVKQGKFREDLFYRLNVIRLNLPALRERREDIPLLVDFFMQQLAKQLKLPAKTLAAPAMHALQQYDWRGNVRQLENICRWLMVMATGQVVQIDDLPPEIIAFHQPLPESPHAIHDNSGIKQDERLEPLEQTIQSDDSLTVDVSVSASDWLTPLSYWAQQALRHGERDIATQATALFEKCLLQTALDHTGQHKSEAAFLLGWGRNTLTRKYQQLIDNNE